MENATKALLIAAGVLISIMVLSLLVMMYNQISGYYGQQQILTEAEQLAEFNSVYENYNRKNIRGSDLISLMNRIIDYNQSQSYDEEVGYLRIEVTITIGSYVDEFEYPNDSYTVKKSLVKSTIKNTGTEKTVEELDNELIAITETENNLINDYPDLNLTSSKLQKLSSNVSNIVLSKVMELNDTPEDSEISNSR